MKLLVLNWKNKWFEHQKEAGVRGRSKQNLERAVSVLTPVFPREASTVSPSSKT